MKVPTTYDKAPFIAVHPDAGRCAQGWPDIAERLRGSRLIAIECYPGVFLDEIIEALRPTTLIRAEDAYRPPEDLDDWLQPLLTADPVFGKCNNVTIEDFFHPQKLAAARARVEAAQGPVLVIGAGASLIARQSGILVYADLARWEIQQRQRRRQITNLGTKRAFFVDWRAADRLKRQLFDGIDFLLDTNAPGQPKMITGGDFRHGLELAATRPFRVVPFFDPGPWGGQWMREKFHLPEGPPNYAWCFDCVPEENSLLLGFGAARVEVPALDLVLRHPRELLGDPVFHRFGAEFPIRFDLLDTIGGGNLSLQVHPLTAYIRQHFGMDYTQDESYYMLDAGPDAVVYLGLKDGIDPEAMAARLRQVQPFPAEDYVNAWPARKHDHFLIPGGTIHCSGADSMVLEISATPYIFTFKLWDWGRLGLDGKPRPIHLDHGLANIQWSRTTEWTRRNLVNRVEPVAQGPGWREERTGLHELEFIETRRHWFTAPVEHDTAGTVNVLNLVEGGEAIVESPTQAFEPFPVHYAETFIVPAAVGRYTIRPSQSAATELATLKAYVRSTHNA
ncbi:MAG: class I mannose-6-phosphate isomerase [Acidobacteria bacterium]|nr:class I mannose-6-phosphate isomerase [Acidobacteriota bacterium]